MSKVKDAREYLRQEADLLRRWHHKARCVTTQGQARRAWRCLRLCLTEGEARLLATAWSHAVSDEGPTELDDAVRNVGLRLVIDRDTRSVFDYHERRCDSGRVGFWRRAVITRALGREAEREARVAQAIAEIRRLGKMDKVARLMAKAVPLLFAPEYQAIVKRLLR